MAELPGPPVCSVCGEQVAHFERSAARSGRRLVPHENMAPILSEFRCRRHAQGHWTGDHGNL